ncbi:hypothetical protein JQ588_14710 [Bradyrhizobium liaoningense]|nr:hypothetical protein [Bradyrhizobium liaoningense]
MQYPEDCQVNDNRRIRDFCFSLRRSRELVQINVTVNFGIAPRGSPG